jgi:hypothetical protein
MLPRSACRSDVRTVVPPHYAPDVQVWFKHDLRTDDHPGLLSAAAAAAPVAPCYCFDERLYGHLLRTPLGFEGAEA